MKLEKLTKIVPNEGLLRTLWGSSYEADVAASQQGQKKDVGQNELVTHLFAAAIKDNILHCISTLIGSQEHRGTCKKLLRKIQQYATRNGAEHGLESAQIEKIVSMCSEASKKGGSKKQSGILTVRLTNSDQHQPMQKPKTESGQASVSTNEKAKRSNDPSALAITLPSQFDQFPEEWCTFDQLEGKAMVLKSSREIGHKIIDEIKRREKTDPSITCLTKKDATSSEIASRYNPPYDAFRAGRDIPGAFFNGSDVHTDLQKFLLTGCPKGPQDTADFFDTVLHQGIRIMISLNQHEEPKSRYYDFWENARLKTLNLRDGWSLEKIYEKILAEYDAGNDGDRVPKIIESTLIATKGDQQIELKHFHYDGWRDKFPMPSERLLSTLYERIEQDNPSPGTPIAINCKGGVGRSGTVAVGFYLRRYIDKNLAEGEKSRVNIPEIIYREFRRRRSGIIGQPTQLAQVYSMASRYYLQRKAR